MTSQTPPTTPSASTTTASTSTYLLTVRSTLIWGVALLCGSAAAVVAVWSVHDAHIVVQVLAGLGAGIAGTLGSALTLNSLIDPGDP